jgi:hypothetical protein
MFKYLKLIHLSRARQSIVNMVTWLGAQTHTHTHARTHTHTHRTWLEASEPLAVMTAA